MRGIRVKLVVSLFLLVLLTVISSRIFFRTTFSEKRIALGTFVEITLVQTDYRRARKALNAAFEEINRIERIMSFHNPRSELCLLNESAYIMPMRPSDELFAIIKRALAYSELSDGAFDVTATSVKRKEGYKFILLNEDTLEVKRRWGDAKIDLGGIAKGYAVDRASAVLKEEGMENFLVNAGGDIRTRGRGPRGPWQIAIQDPEDSSKYLAKISLTNQAVCSSGNYLREHIVATREEGGGDILSATVIAPECETADALATILFLFPSAQGIALAEERDGVEALIVRRVEGKRTISKSSGFPE